MKKFEPEICSIRVWFSIPTLLININGSIEHDLIEQMDDELMKLDRCCEFIGGHYGGIVFDYPDLKSFNEFKDADKQKVQDVCDKYLNKVNDWQ